MKRVFINGRFLTQPLSGMQRFAQELVTALDALLGETPEALPGVLQVEVLVPPGPCRMPAWQHVQVRQVGRLTGHAWEQLELAWAARDGILLNLTSCGPLLHGQSVLVMHDAAVFMHPEHFSRAYGTWHRVLRPRLARRAAALGTISEFSRRELARCCGVSPDAFTVIPDSAEHIVHQEAQHDALEKFGLTAGAYALTVGNQSPNKNIALAIAAFEAAAPQGWTLAVAGGGADKIFGKTTPHGSSRVRTLGRVSDAELKTLYQHAALFLFPSRYEGFGVPPLEAMSLGCPVLSSDATAMPEVLGDAATYFPSDDAQALAAQIRALAADRERLHAMSRAGKDQAQRYSWAAGARTLATLVQRIAAPAHP